MGGQGPFIVVGALKFARDYGLVTNELVTLRDKANWRSEAHFSKINRTTEHLYRETIKIVAESGARFRYVVHDRRQPNLDFERHKEPWKRDAQLAIRLLRSATWTGETVTSIIDYVSTPRSVNYENYIHVAVNRLLGEEQVVSVLRMDSKTCWGLQLADILTGAVAHQYMQSVKSEVKATTPKGRVAGFVAETYNLESLIMADSKKLKMIGLPKKD